MTDEQTTNKYDKVVQEAEVPKRCPKCGLRIRCRNVERHEAGHSHNNRLKTFAEEARRKAKGG